MCLPEKEGVSARAETPSWFIGRGDGYLITPSSLPTLVNAAIALVSVADTKRNTEQLIILAQCAHEAGAEITVFPELCITGYTCGDPFTQQTLLQGAEESVSVIADIYPLLTSIRVSDPQ